MGETELTEWDDAKRERVFRDRAIKLEALHLCLDGRPRLIIEDRRHDYGEPRFNTLTRWNGSVLLITFTPRNGRLRLITARLANRREREAYGRYEEGAGGHQRD